MTTFLSVMANWFEWLRWIGVAYLLWLGFRACAGAGRRPDQGDAGVRARRAASILRGFAGGAEQPEDAAVLGRLLPAVRERRCRSHVAAGLRRCWRRPFWRSRWRSTVDLGVARRALRRRARRQRQASQPSHRGPADRGGRGSCTGSPILSADPERGSRNAGLSGQALSCGAPPRPASFPWQLQESRWRSGKRLGRVLLNASAESGFGGKAHIAVTSRSFRL